MEIKLQPEDFVKVLEFTVGDHHYVTIAVNLDISTVSPERFYIIKDLSNYPEYMETSILEKAEQIALEHEWYSEEG